MSRPPESMRSRFWCHLFPLVLHATALVLVTGCASRPAANPVTAVMTEDDAAARIACDSVIKRVVTAGHQVYRDTEVATPANLIFENRGPKYPGSREPASDPTMPVVREAATVLTVFVVDSAGQPDTTTVQSIGSVPDKFLQSVKVYLPTARYNPARLAGHPVSQCVKQSFMFVPA